jgi:hypothetical protein
MQFPEFKEFRKIPRLNREIVITEKIDGSNGAVVVQEDGSVLAQSRSRFIVPTADNFGFAGWVEKNADELRKLGPGYHYGEWWGLGIQRGYGLTERRFSLFNVSRWADERPACCHVVPTLYAGPFHTDRVEGVLDGLRANGSVAAPGFMKPEGVIVFHTAGNLMFKATLEKDDEWKGKSKVAA